MFGAKNPDKIKELTAELLEKGLPPYFKQITSILQETEGEFIAGKQLTAGDIFLANAIDCWEDFVDPKLLEGYPALKALKDAVFNLPEIKAWVEVRPKAFI